MASAIVNDRKYDEGIYHYKKPVLNPDINIEIGYKLYLNDKLYGTIMKESESFYYIHTELSEGLCEFQKSSVQDKIANKVFRLVD